MNHPNRKLAYTRYKLVTQDYTTHNDTKWRDKDGKWLTVTATGPGNIMCGPDVVHWYDHPVIAVIANKNHANINNPRLLVIKCSKPVAHDGLKGGSKSAKAVKEIPLPVISTEQKVEFAIRVSFEVMTELKVNCPKWFEWASDWLAGKNRKDSGAAREAHSAAAAAAAAAWSAADAAWSADAAAAAAAAADAAAYAAAAAAAAGKLFLKVLKAMKLDMKIKIQVTKKTESA